MTASDSPPDDLNSRADFDQALNQLVQEAVDGNIDVCGGYRIQMSDDDHLDLGVEIYRVVKST